MSFTIVVLFTFAIGVLGVEKEKWGSKIEDYLSEPKNLLNLQFVFYILILITIPGAYFVSNINSSENSYFIWGFMLPELLIVGIIGFFGLLIFNIALKENSDYIFKISLINAFLIIPLLYGGRVLREILDQNYFRCTMVELFQIAPCGFGRFDGNVFDYYWMYLFLPLLIILMSITIWDIKQEARMRIAVKMIPVLIVLGIFFFWLPWFFLQRGIILFQ